MEDQIVMTNDIAVTNAVIEVAPKEAPQPPVQSTPTQSTWYIWAAAVVIIVLLLIKWARSSGRKNTRNFRDQILNDVVEYLSKGGGDSDALFAELKSAVDLGGTLETLPLKNIQKLECAFKKLPNERCERTIMLLVKQVGGKASMVKISREYSWEYMPDEVRSQMIRTEKDLVVVSLYAG